MAKGHPAPVEDRLLEHIEVHGDCWVWDGAVQDQGYPIIRVGKRNAFAARESWKLFREDPLPAKIKNTCGNPRCINPQHWDCVASGYVKKFHQMVSKLENGCWHWLGTIRGGGPRCAPRPVWCVKGEHTYVHRCTKSHEYIFLLSKQEKYFFDGEAIEEPAVGGQSGAAASFKRTGSKRAVAHPGQVAGTHRPDRPDVAYAGETRNRRSVWTISTKPFKDAHFATFPPDLIEPCILAGCPEGGVVLDPFGGAGTTGLVAQRHRRNAILLELNPEYAAMARRRIDAEAPPAPAEPADLFGDLPTTDVRSLFSV